MTMSGAASEWAALTEYKNEIPLDLRKLFAADSNRAGRFSFTAADLTVDLSKHMIDGEVVARLVALAHAVDLPGRIEAMFSGERINTTEDRPVLHTALRASAADSFTVDGMDVVADVHGVLQAMAAFAARVRSGEWLGFDGRPIKTVVNVGIGGSDLGPVMAYKALRHYRHPRLDVRFVSNIDPAHLAAAIDGLNPAETCLLNTSPSPRHLVGNLG